MSPVTSLWEVAEELGGGKGFVIKDESVEGKCSKLAEPELKADLEPSVPGEEASGNKSRAVHKEVTTEPFWSGNYTLEYRGTLYSHVPHNNVSFSNILCICWWSHKIIIIYYYNINITILGTAVAQWLKCCATNREVAGLIPAGVIVGIFH